MLCCMNLQWVFKAVSELVTGLFFFLFVVFVLAKVFQGGSRLKRPTTPLVYASPPSLVRLKVLSLC